MHTQKYELHKIGRFGIVNYILVISSTRITVVRSVSETHVNSVSRTFYFQRTHQVSLGVAHDNYPRKLFRSMCVPVVQRNVFFQLFSAMCVPVGRPGRGRGGCQWPL